MHEMSICQSLITLIEEQAQAHGAKKVTNVRLEIGRFAGVEPQALQFGFDVVTDRTVAQGAGLEIVDLPGRAWCFDCAKTVDIFDRLDDCPNCGSARLHITGGNELRIKDLEVI